MRRSPTAAIARSRTISIARAASSSSASTGAIPIWRSCSSACWRAPARATSTTSRSCPGSAPSKRRSSTPPIASACSRRRTWPSWRAQLKEAVGDEIAPALPDDDDFEGWLALLAEEPAAAGTPGRAEIEDRLDALARKLRAEARLGEAGRPACSGASASSRRRSGAPRCCSRSPAIFEHEVGDLSKAFTALVAAYKEHPRPSDSDGWNELERLAQATGLWSELLSELAEVMPTLPDGERAQAWLRLARLYGDKLNAAEYALTSLDEALKLEPELADAAELRIALYKRLERWSELAAALGEAGRFVEQAEVLEARLGRRGAGGGGLSPGAGEGSAAARGARGARERCLRRAATGGRWPPCSTSASSTPAVEEARALEAEAAALFAERLDDRKQAIARYEALAAEDAARSRRAARARAALLRPTGRRRSTSSAWGGRPKRWRAIASARRSTGAWPPCGRRSPARTTRAEECLEKLLAVDPRSEDALRSLERLYYAERKWPELIDACRRHAALVPPPNAGEIHFQVAAIYEHELQAISTRRSTPTSTSRRTCPTTPTRWRR